MRNAATIIHMPKRTPHQGVLNPDRLYIADNGRCHCGRLECAGMEAFYMGIALDGLLVIDLLAAAAQAKRLKEPFDVSAFACESCGRKTCPECEGIMEKVDGQISEPIMSTVRGATEMPRRVRPAVYFACCSCEHCEEVSRG